MSETESHRRRKTRTAAEALNPPSGRPGCPRGRSARPRTGAGHAAPDDDPGDGRLAFGIERPGARATSCWQSHCMAHHLMINSTQDNWRLHVDEDAEDVQERLINAAGPVAVRVVVADQLKPSTVHVNPKAAAWWAVVEVPDPDAGGSYPPGSQQTSTP